MPQRSSSMEHKAILLPNVKFWWGYNADDPYSLVVVSSSQRVNLRFAPPGIPVDFSRFHPAQWREICAMENQLLYKVHQPPQEIQTKFGAANLSYSTIHINSISLISKQGMACVRWYKVINSESQIFHWPSVDGPHSLTFDSILSMKLYSSWNIWIQRPTTTKRLRVELNIADIMRARALYWLFCWYLVPPKLKSRRH